MQVLDAITKIQAPYAILVKGGGAAYWYIFHLTGREIPLKDIDLVLNNPSLNNSQIAQDFTDRLNSLLPDYGFTLLYNEYNIPVKVASEQIDIDLFVNDEPTGKHVTLEGLNVPKISDLIDRENQDIKNYSFEESFFLEEGNKEMADMFKEKVERKISRLALLLRIKTLLQTENPDIYRKLF